MARHDSKLTTGLSQGWPRQRSCFYVLAPTPKRPRLAAVDSRRDSLQGPQMQHADADPQTLGTACMAVKHASLGQLDATGDCSSRCMRLLGPLQNAAGI